MHKLLLASRRQDDGSAIPGHRVQLLTLTMTSSLGMVASTIYVPSIPAIAAALETSIARVQLTFVGYLLAFAATCSCSDRCPTDAAAGERSSAAWR